MYIASFLNLQIKLWYSAEKHYEFKKLYICVSWIVITVILKKSCNWEEEECRDWIMKMFWEILMHSCKSECHWLQTAFDYISFFFKINGISVTVSIIISTAFPTYLCIYNLSNVHSANSWHNHVPGPGKLKKIDNLCLNGAYIYLRNLHL